MKTKKHLLILAALLAPVCFAQGACAQDYPLRPIRIVVPFAPGGGTDFAARTLGQKMGEAFGQPVIVDNRPGAATIIAAEMVAKAPPDGYTLLLSSGSTFAINPGLNKKLPYDPVRDYAPIGLFATFSLLLVTNPEFPAKTVSEFIAAVRAKPGGVQFGSPGLGSSHQLAMEMFAQKNGLRMVHVPYKGAAPAMQDIMAGRIPTMFQDLATALQQIKAGRIRAIAIASPERSSSVPEVPTISESGMPGFEASAWIGVVAPAGTPGAIIDKLNGVIVKALEDPALLKKLSDFGAEPLKSTPAQFSAYMKSEITKWAEVIRAGNITAD